MTVVASDHSPLEVYLVPLAVAKYELYCETPDEDDDPTESASVGGIFVRFREVLAQAQESRRAKRLAAVPTVSGVSQSWVTRVHNRLISWIAEAIVDWRVLWKMRTQSAVTLFHPADLDGSVALEIARSGLRRDADRERRWLIIDGTLAAVIGPLLFFVPGPNLIAYYFVFRSVGHWLAWRGARNGLVQVSWQTKQSPELADLRDILSLAPDDRARFVRDVEARLDLEHLAAFVERIVVRVGRSSKNDGS